MGCCLRADNLFSMAWKLGCDSGLAEAVAGAKVEWYGNEFRRRKCSKIEGRRKWIRSDFALMTHHGSWIKMQLQSMFCHAKSPAPANCASSPVPIFNYTRLSHPFFSLVPCSPCTSTIASATTFVILCLHCTNKFYALGPTQASMFHQRDFFSSIFCIALHSIHKTFGIGAAHSFA